MTHRPDSPRLGDVLLFLVAMFLGLALIGQMDELHRLNQENEALRVSAERCRMAMEVRP